MKSNSTSPAQFGVEIMTPPGMEEMASQLQGMFQNMGGSKTQKRKMKIREARSVLIEDEAAKLINDEEIKLQALEIAEQNGIVFIDELDKVAKRSEFAGADVSREGVQRDLLPLVEGCTVSTRHGMVKTDHMLFIASGAFHLSRPSDLIPELQGRLPIRVELRALTVEDFTRILTEPQASLTEQYTAREGHRGRGPEFTEGRGAADRGNLVASKRIHREYRRQAPAHRAGTPAGRDILRGPGSLR